MVFLSSKKVAGAALICGSALALGGCGSMTTYGTGTTAAAQTLEDIGGILSLGGGQKSGAEVIDYSPRPPIVAPPTTDTPLPPPGSETVVATAGDWPVDPDVDRARMDQLAKEKAANGETLIFNLPKSEKTGPTIINDKRTSAERRLDERLHNGGKDWKAEQKLFADAKMAKVGSFDEEGNPVRRYLTEPPVTYREPDPESPVVITEKPKPKNSIWSWWPF